MEYLRIVKASFFVVSAVLLAGCGGDTGYSGPTGTVSGTITLDDKPVAANLTFMNSIDGFTASGVADGSGKFSLQSNGETAIPVGKYQVGVTAAADGPEMSPEAAMEASMDGGGESTSGTGAIPANYASPAGSGLSFEVKEGDNSFEVKMTKE